jgi:ribonucleoside-diphosphate reductase beta chain
VAGHERRGPRARALGALVADGRRGAHQPGFVDGCSRIHHDEQRHIGYGVWYLRDAVRRDPALADEARATLRALLPAVAESLTPPDRDGTDWDALGASAQEIREFALGGLTRRLKIIGAELG